MLTDRHEQDLARMLKAGLPAPSPGCEARALAVLTDTRPRRHPNLLTFIIVAALILLLAAGVFAAVRHFFVEGTLHFHDVTFDSPEDRGNWRVFGARFFSGELEWETDERPSFAGDISPDGDRVVISTAGTREWPPTGGDLLLVDPDWTNDVNLTEIAGLGGINCEPKWSPDGALIAFLHSDPVEEGLPCHIGSDLCDPVEGELPCHTGFDLWVMNADGSDAHRVTPEDSLPINPSIAWSPDSSRLTARWQMDHRTGSGSDEEAFTTDIWGRDIRPLPNVGAEIAWSPDGAMLVSRGGEPTEVDGQPGQRRYLVLTNADGGEPRELVEQFVSDADALANRVRHPDHPDQKGRSDDFWIASVRMWAGPCRPVWSPDSRKIAFLAAMPFDPHGPYFKDQIEVWVYDLDTDELIRVTNDDVAQTSLSWK